MDCPENDAKREEEEEESKQLQKDDEQPFEDTETGGESTDCQNKKQTTGRMKRFNSEELFFFVSKRLETKLIRVRRSNLVLRSFSQSFNLLLFFFLFVLPWIKNSILNLVRFTPFFVV